MQGVQLSVIGFVRLHNFKIADNKPGGIRWPAEYAHIIHGRWGIHNGIDNSLIVGLSKLDEFNPTARLPGIDREAVGAETALIGMKMANSHRLTVQNVTFANFEHNETHALCAAHRNGPGAWQARFANIVWVNAPNRIAWGGQHEGVFNDLDGTFSDLRQGNYSVVPYNSLLDAFSCFPAGVKYGSRGYPGMICPNTSFQTIHVKSLANQLPPVIRLSYSPPGEAFVAEAQNSEYLTNKFRIDRGPDGLVDFLNSFQIQQQGTISTSPLDGVFLEEALWYSRSLNGTGTVSNGSFVMVFTQSNTGGYMYRVGIPSTNYTHILWAENAGLRPHIVHRGHICYPSSLHSHQLLHKFPVLPPLSHNFCILVITSSFCLGPCLPLSFFDVDVWSSLRAL